MKTALVIDWPSVDAPAGAMLSEWEASTTKELAQLAGFKADAVFTAYPKHVRKWGDLFLGGKPVGPLTAPAEAARKKLLADLQGFDMALTMGQHAMFCATGETKIDTYRGTHIDAPDVPGLQVVPTYAPYIYARMNWSERPVVVSAMQKAKQRYQDRECTIYIPDTVADLYAFSTQHIRGRIVFDVETCKERRITEFSLATDSRTCLYVALEDRARNALWSEQDELDIWLWLHFLAQRKDLSWGFHNATYDLSYLAEYGIFPLGHIFDTMLRHHAWQPELEKSLGFLAALHVPTRAWKHLRTKAKADYNKAGAI